MLLKKGVKIEQYNEIPCCRCLPSSISNRDFSFYKIKQKVSGCFRTDSGADDFAKLHSIAETAMKNGNSKFNAILAVVQQ